MRLSSVTLSVLFLSFVSCFGSLKIHFVDVGQGNCTIVTFAQKRRPEPALLVDCGSLSCTFKGHTFKKKQIAYIVNTIYSNALITGCYDLSVVVSHPDPDHYNWFKQVLTDCLNKGINVTKVYLGAVESLYPKDFITYLTNLFMNDNSSDDSDEELKIIYPTKDGSTQKMERISLSPDVNYKLLPALHVIQKRQSNDSSLVVRVEHNGTIGLITGDATGKTTDHILEYCPDLEAHVLQASHHGADAEGCNNQTWIDRIEPTTVVMSSGINGNFFHPRASVVKRYLDSIEENNGSWHVVYVGASTKSDQTPLKSYMRFENQYEALMTSKSLYSTLSNGTIIYTFKKDSGSVSIDGNRFGKLGSPKKTSVLESILGRPLKEFSLKSLVRLDVSNLKIDDADEQEKTQLRKILSILCKFKPPALLSLSLAHNSINRKNTVELLIKLLTKLDIREFSIIGNGLRQRFQKDLVKAWNNRGMEIELVSG